MTKEILADLLATSLVDFRETVPRVATDVLQALRADLEAQAGVSTADFGIRVIDEELSRRA